MKFINYYVVSSPDTHILVWADTYLDASTYHFVDKVNSWLDESGICYSHQQWIKRFEWHLYSKEDVTLFLLRWS